MSRSGDNDSDQHDHLCGVNYHAAPVQRIKLRFITSVLGFIPSVSRLVYLRH